MYMPKCEVYISLLNNEKENNIYMYDVSFNKNIRKKKVGKFSSNIFVIQFIKNICMI